MRDTIKRTALGFIVVEAAEDFEQPLCLRTGDGFPEAGILDWRGDGNGRVFLFRSRAAARAAIKRTHAFGDAFEAGSSYPRRENCQIVLVEAEASDG